MGQNGRALLADGRFACPDADSAAVIRPVLAMCLWRIGSIKYSEYAKFKNSGKPHGSILSLRGVVHVLISSICCILYSYVYVLVSVARQGYGGRTITYIVTTA